MIILRLDERDHEIDVEAFTDEAGYFAVISFDENIQLVVDRDGLQKIADMATKVAAGMKGGRYEFVPE